MPANTPQTNPETGLSLDSGPASVAVIGLGYVGLPLAVEFARASRRVIGLEVDARKVDSINKGESYIPDVPSDDLKALIANGTLSATTDFDVLREVDAIVIAVPTPLRKTKDPDVTYIVAAAEEIARRLKPGHLVVLESTTYPGTTEEILLPKFEASGLKVGTDFFLAFSPERVDPGSPTHQTRSITKIVGGVTPVCTEKALALYRGAVDVVLPVSSAKVAETAKLLENTFRAVNIGLVNELALMCHHLGVDVWEVIDAAATKPFGFMKHLPGPGIGGHCIPLDPYYLAWKARLSGFEAKFIGLAGEVNGHMPEHVVHLVGDGLNEDGKALRGSRVLVLGLAYKKDVDDVRESPAFEIIQLLRAKGAVVRYNDPFVPGTSHEGWTSESAHLTPDLLRDQDAVIVVTDHSAYDWESILPHCRLFIDTRNVARGRENLPGRLVKL